MNSATTLYISSITFLAGTARHSEFKWRCLGYDTVEFSNKIMYYEWNSRTEDTTSTERTVGVRIGSFF